MNIYLSKLKTEVWRRSFKITQVELELNEKSNNPLMTPMVSELFYYGRWLNSYQAIPNYPSLEHFYSDQRKEKVQDTDKTWSGKGI